MKSKKTAALLAFFLGWMGMHRFYLGQPMLGIGYIAANLFFRSPVAWLLGIIDAIAFLMMSQAQFDQRYNRGQANVPVARRQARQNRANRRAVRGRPQEQVNRRQDIKQQRSRKLAVNKRNPFKLSGKRKLEAFVLDEALEDFKKGLEVSPNDPELHFEIASAYSLIEEKEKAFYHLSQAIGYGFKDYDKIKSTDALSFIRVQAEFEEFEKAGYRITTASNVQAESAPVKQDKLLAQLQRLSELRKNGLISENDFEVERRKLMR